MLEEKGMLKLAQGRHLMEEGDLQQLGFDAIRTMTEIFGAVSLSAKCPCG